MPTFENFNFSINIKILTKCNTCSNSIGRANKVHGITIVSLKETSFSITYPSTLPLLDFSIKLSLTLLRMTLLLRFKVRFYTWEYFEVYERISIWKNTILLKSECLFKVPIMSQRYMERRWKRITIVEPLSYNCMTIPYKQLLINWL